MKIAAFRLPPLPCVLLTASWLMHSFSDTILMKLDESAYADNSRWLQACAGTSIPSTNTDYIAITVLSVIFFRNEFLLIMLPAGRKNHPLPVHHAQILGELCIWIAMENANSIGYYHKYACNYSVMSMSRYISGEMIESIKSADSVMIEILD